MNSYRMNNKENKNNNKNKTKTEINSKAQIKSKYKNARCAKGFGGFHPLVNFAYFLFVIGLSMVIQNPICSVVSFAGGFVYSAMLRGGGAVKRNLLMTVPLMIAMALINPAFNHRGVTILTYLPSGNPLTLESMIYGVLAAITVANVILWFSCYNVIMTSDKFIYIFGRIIPALSLVLSMALRLVPKLSAQTKEVAKAQKCMGVDVSGKGNGVVKRAKAGLNILSVMVTRALEDAVETSDSMKARGYGLPGRTAFSVFRFGKRDVKAIIMIFVCGICVITGIIFDKIGFKCFPYITMSPITAVSRVSYIAYGVLLFLPTLIEVMEERRWKTLKNKALKYKI